MEKTELEKNAARYIWYREAVRATVPSTIEKFDSDIDLGIQVFEALNAAKDNGYSFKGMPVDAIAEDVVDKCSDLEGKDPADLYLSIQLWLLQNPQ